MLSALHRVGRIIPVRVCICVQMRSGNPATVFLRRFTSDGGCGAGSAVEEKVLLKTPIPSFLPDVTILPSGSDSSKDAASDDSIADKSDYAAELFTDELGQMDAIFKTISPMVCPPAPAPEQRPANIVTIVSITGL